MFTKLNLEYFRAFEKASIDLNKINLFFGPNNSGKSSLLSALNLFSQTVQTMSVDTDIMMSGKFEDFGTYYDMVNGNDESKKIKIGIESELAIPERSHFKSSKSGRRVYESIEKIRKGYIEIQIGYSKYRHEIQLMAMEIQIPEENLLVRIRRNRLGRYVVESMKGFDGLSEEELNQLIEVRNILPVIYFGKLSIRHPSYANLRLINIFVRKFREQIGKMEFISAFRSTPQRFYPLTGESHSNVGRYGEKALEIMIQDGKRKGKLKKDLLKLTSDWLKEAEIARKLYTLSLTDRYFELILENFHTGESENLTDVGFGCSQILPIIIAGFNISEGGLFIVQEPEIHLHPKAQAELGSLFKILYGRGTQLLIETHSEYLMLRIQSHIAKGSIKAKDVNVYYIDPKDKRTRRKKVVKIDIGDDGYFTKEWPKGFFPERLKEAKRLAGLAIQKG